MLRAGVAVALFAAPPVLAASVDTPECHQALAAADGLVRTIQSRDKLFVAGDTAKNCALLKQNLVDMIKAREPMSRCMTGHDRNENLGQMDGSISDIRDVLSLKCKNQDH